MGKHGDSVTYDGVRWHPRKDGYYQNKHRGLLHRFMWEQANGPIPDGMQVHHRNHDKRDNRLDNFALVSAADHWQEHGDERGADWHSLGGKAAWANAQYRTYTCQRCGRDFQSRGTAGARYCSAACRDYASRARERRVCSMCGSEFECAARYPTRTCSRSCTSKYAYAQRRQGL